MSLKLIDPGKHRQLFLDDFSIEQIMRVKRTVHPPKKMGPVLRPNRSLGETSIQSLSLPQWNSEKDIWEWWYRGKYVYYATSTDGESWETPSLGLYECNGSKDNNIACNPEGEERRLFHIIRDERDPDPQRRYKALFIGDYVRDLATSPDGFKWTMLEAPPIPSSDTSYFAYDEISGQYIATVKRGTRWGRSVWLSTSRDFVHWTKPELIMHTDEIDWENCRKRVREVIDNPAYITPPIIDDEDYIAELYMMAVMPYEGFYIGFPRIFNPVGAIPPPEMNFTRINQTELAVSRDLYNWERVADRALFMAIDPWDGVSYDTSQVWVCGRPHVRENGEIWIYYNGSRFPARKDQYMDYNASKELFRLNIDPDLFNEDAAISMAKLRPDGFVSLDAEDQGIVITKPFMLNGENLYVNVDARWGELHVEIIDAETMKTHDGFVVHRGQTIPITGDHLRRRIAFKDNTSLIFEKPVRLRFIIHKARLYSFWLEQ